MTLKTYILLAVIAFGGFACWLWLGTFGTFLYAGLVGCGLLFYYPIVRLFLAVVRRLER